MRIRWQKIDKVIDIDEKQKRAKHTTLQNSAQDRFGRRERTAKLDRLGPARKPC